MTDESTFDMGILSTEELAGEDMDALDSILGGNEIEKISAKPKATPPPAEKTVEVKEEEPVEEDIDAILGEEKKVKKETPKEEEQEDGEEVNPYTTIAATLFEQGILTPDGEELPDINSPEALLEAFQQEKKKGASEVLNTFLDSKGETYRQAFDAIFVNGVDPREYFTALNRIEDYAALDMDSESVQEQVAREYYRRQGWKDVRISKNLQLLKDAGELGEYSKEFQQELIEKDAQALQEKVEGEKQKKLDEQRQDGEYRNSVTKILQEKLKTKDFDGIPVTDKAAREALDFLYTKKYRAGNREITEWDKFILDLNKPENHPLKVKLALLKANNFDFSVIKQKESSKQNNSLFGELASRTTKSKKEALKNEQDSFWG